MNLFAQTIDSIQDILAICPCCGELFRLVEGKFIFPEKRPKPCEYLDLVGFENSLWEEEDRLASAEERFLARLEKQRRQLTVQGRTLAKKRLRKIDPNFSARNIDLQDVKVIFDPVEYTIFHGLSTERGVAFVEFVSRSPDSRRQEAIATSIDKTIRNGDVVFETLRMKDDGSFEIRRA